MDRGTTEEVTLADLNCADERLSMGEVATIITISQRQAMVLATLLCCMQILYRHSEHCIEMSLVYTRFRLIWV